MTRIGFADRIRAEWLGALSTVALIVLALFAISYLRIPIPGWQLLDSLRMHLSWLLLAIALMLAFGGGYGRAVIAVALACLVLFDVHTTLGQIRAGAVAPPTGRDIKVVSFNLLAPNTANGEAIVSALLAEDADFVFLQEARPVEPYRAELAQVYPYQLGCPSRPSDCASLLLSKHVLTNASTRTLGLHSPQRFLTATADIDGKPIDLALVHLTKPYFDHAAFHEVSELRRYVNELDNPVIVAGDFNAAPWSANLRYLAQRTPLVFAPNSPATWPVKLGALGVPIDHILATDPIAILSLSAFDDPMGSNHRGIVGMLTLTASDGQDSASEN